MTEPGQTDNFSLSDHIKAIIDHAGKGVIEYCIYDTGELVPDTGSTKEAKPKPVCIATA